MSGIAFLLFSGRKFGGMERRYARLVEFLCRKGIGVTLLCTHDALKGISDLGIDLPSHVRLIDIGWVPTGGLAGKVNRLYGLARAFWMMAFGRYKHVHIIANPGILVCLYAWLSRFLPPFSFSVVDSRLGFDSRVVDSSVRHARAVDCLSDTIAADIRMRCKGFEDLTKIRVSPCSFTDISRARWQENRDIDVLMMARFSPEKGYDLLSQSLSLLPENLEVHLCGFGPQPPEIPGAKVYESSNPFEVLSRSKIFLSLQRTENYPSQALLEAMASGCAIIATDVGETRKLLDESCALLIPPNPSHLANAITKLIDDPGLGQRLGFAAREHLLKEHTLERFAAYFEMNILGDGAKRLSTTQNRRRVS